MSRLHHALRAAGTGYVLVAATAVYALGSVPMALHYLTKERFGLWALLGSLLAYMSMIDLGMSSSVARHLVDAKDNRHDGAYGSMIKTGWLVLIVQAAILMVIGFACAGVFSRWMDIPPELDRTFQLMVWLQCGVVGFGFVTKIFCFILLAHQRMDLTNYAGILSLAVNFLGLWMFFALGSDVYSLIYASLAASVAGAIFQVLWCWKLSLFPHADGWGKVSGHMFKEMFNYGRDVFLVSLGSQMIMASQTMIITRQMGLEAAAAWSIGTRTFILVSQSIWRVTYSALSALAEMLTRNELDRLKIRYPSLVTIVTSLSVYCAVTFALCNSTFVFLWTSGKVSWSPLNDVLLGVWMVILTVCNLHGSFVLCTKKVRFMKYVYFLEGVAFILLAIFTVKRCGLPGMILCSIICSVCFSGAYTVWRVSRNFGFSLNEVALRWSKNAALVLACFGPIAAAVWWSTRGLNLQLQLGIGVFAAVLLGLPIFLRMGVPEPLKQEFMARAPKRFGSLVGCVVGCRSLPT